MEGAVLTDLNPGSRNRGRPSTAWFDNITYWSGWRGATLMQATRYRSTWRALVSLLSPNFVIDDGLNRIIRCTLPIPF